RRHTRFSRDWSSDVCSSDLDQLVVGVGVEVDADERGPALAEGALADRRPGHLSLARDLADAELAGARVVEEQLVASVAVDVDRRDRRPAARPRAGGGPAPELARRVGDAVAGE